MKKIWLVPLLMYSVCASAELIDVKYRSAPLDTAGTGLKEYTAPRDIFIQRILHDEAYDYLIVQLSRDYFQYCGVSKSRIAEMLAHSDPGRYFGYEIKGHFDCRVNDTPPY